MTGDLHRIAEMEMGLRGAIAAGNHVFAIMCYVLLVQDQWDPGRFDVVDCVLQEGLGYARTRQVDFYVAHLVEHQAKLDGLRGDWTAAEAGLRDLVGIHAGGEPGSLRYSLPALAIIATRRGAADADKLMS